MFSICSHVIDVDEMTARHAAALARVAVMAERLAAKHADRALETDDPRIDTAHTSTFHKATRVLRQSMALKAKLIREAQQGVREATRRADWAKVTARCER